MLVIIFPDPPITYSFPSATTLAWHFRAVFIGGPSDHSFVRTLYARHLFKAFKKVKVKCVLGYYWRTGVLSGNTIVIVYLIPEPELYFYLTLALVFRQVRHSINNVSWVALFGRVLNHIWGLLCHFLIIATLTLPYVQQMRRAYWRNFFVESESYTSNIYQ